MNRIKKLTPFQIALLVIILYFLIMLGFYAITHESLGYGGANAIHQGTLSGNTAAEITEDTVIRQYFTPEANAISAISIPFSFGGAEVDDVLTVAVKDPVNDKILAQKKVPSKHLKDGAWFDVYFPHFVTGVLNKELVLEITSKKGIPGSSVLLYDDSGSRDRKGVLTESGENKEEVICFTVVGRNQVPFFQYYLVLTLGIGLFIIIYSIRSVRRFNSGKKVGVVTLISQVKQYSFLLQQLVSRDFKTKYKRSILGVLWSLLNPLLTMSVQYVVFSRLFRFSIQHYPVYLLTGIVLFGFMSETTSLSMMSIVQNSNLINKVFVPKYIYPLSKVFSSSVNFIFSFTSLIIVIIVTGVAFSGNAVFLVYGLFTLMLFIIGLSFMLSSIMVFFHDTQFLYTIILQIWMYLTPLFYPEEILPAFVLRLEQLNPMYHFVKFFRVIILQGVVPDAKVWFFCGFFAVVSLAVGAIVFNKNQNKFILYL